MIPKILTLGIAILVLASPGELTAQERPVFDTGGQDSSSVGAYFYFDFGSSSVLQLSNTTDRSAWLSVRARLRGVAPVDLGEVLVGPLGHLTIDLRQRLAAYRSPRQPGAGPGVSNPGTVPPSGHRWGDGSRPGSLWGTVEISGGTAGIESWVLNQAPAESVSVPSMTARTFAMLPFEGQKVLMGAWWRPTATTRVHWVLTNVSDQAITVKALFPQRNHAMRPGSSIEIPARESRLVRLAQIHPGTSPEGSGWVIFRVASPDLQKASMVGHGFAIDEIRGYSSPAMLRPPASSLASNELQIPGTHLGPAPARHGYPTGTVFDANLLLVNRHEAPIEVFLELQLQGGEAPSRISLRSFTLAPFESRRMSLGEAATLGALPGSQRRRLRLGAFVGLRLQHSGEPGSLFADAVTVNVDLASAFRYSFYGAFRDAAATASRVTSVSFDISGDVRSSIVTKNPSNHRQRYRYHVIWAEGGTPRRYESPLLEIDSQVVRAVDLRELRDAQIPDRHGRRLPLDLTTGHFFVEPEFTRRSVSLMVSNPIIDVRHGTCLECSSAGAVLQLLICLSGGLRRSEPRWSIAWPRQSAVPLIAEGGLARDFAVGASRFRGAAAGCGRAAGGGPGTAPEAATIADVPGPARRNGPD